MFGAVAAGIPSFGDLSWKAPVRAVQVGAFPSQTTTAQTISRSGNGALPSVDGVSLAVGDRLLVAAQSSGYVEGIYTVTSLGSGSAPWLLTRARDCDTAAEMVVGASCYITEGDTWAGTTAVAQAAWTPTTGDPDWRPVPQLNFARQVFTADGTWTKTRPLATVTVTVTGGGGGGGGCEATGASQSASGGGGGGGGTAIATFAASALASSLSVTVGNGGAVSPGSPGGDGAGSAFGWPTGPRVIGHGGVGGEPGLATSGTNRIPGGSGGAAQNGDTNLDGSDGGVGAVIGGNRYNGGFGGSSYLGGSQAAPSAAAGSTGKDYGGGGSGACSGNSTSARAGGAGAPGVVIVDEYWIGPGSFT